MAKKSLSARIEEVIYEKIIQHCQDRQISQAALIEDWARSFLQLPEPETVESRVSRLETELAELRGKSIALWNSG